MLTFPIEISEKLKITIYINDPDEFDLMYLFETIIQLNSKFSNLLGKWITSR
jgi:hypothetical protein